MAIYLAKILTYLELLDTVKGKEMFLKIKVKERKKSAELIAPIKTLLNIKKLTK